MTSKGVHERRLADAYATVEKLERVNDTLRRRLYAAEAELSGETGELTLAQASEIADKTVRTLRLWIRQGRMRASRALGIGPGNGWRVTDLAVLQAVANNWSPPQRLANKVSNELLSSFGGVGL